MKKLLFLSMLLLVQTIINAQKGYVIFTVEIKNQLSDTVIIKDLNEAVVKKLYLKNGTAKQDTIYCETGYYNLYNGGERTTVFLEPKYNLKLTLDASKFDETIKYQGIGAIENNYLAEKFLETEKYGRYSYFVAYAGYDEKLFLKKVDSLLKRKIDFLNTYKDLDDNFKKLETESINIDYLLALSSYESRHRFYKRDRSFKVSKDFPNPYKDFDFNDENYLRIHGFVSFVNSYLQTIAKKERRVNNTDYYIAFVNAIGENIQNENVKNAVYSYFVKYTFSSAKNNLQELYSKLKQVLTDENDIKLLEKQYKQKLKLSKGKKSPSFQLYDMDSNLVKLEDFKGKLVYIDIWASSCAPCIREIPKLKSLQEKLKGKNIVFVSINIDRKIEAWKRIVQKYKLEGYLLHADRDNQFLKEYVVSGIPRFILIDKNGNIINADAPRPGREKLNELLKQYL